MPEERLGGKATLWMAARNGRDRTSGGLGAEENLGDKLSDFVYNS